MWWIINCCYHRRWHRGETFFLVLVASTPVDCTRAVPWLHFQSQCNGTSKLFFFCTLLQIQLISLETLSWARLKSQLQEGKAWNARWDDGSVVSSESDTSEVSVRAQRAFQLACPSDWPFFDDVHSSILPLPLPHHHSHAVLPYSAHCMLCWGGYQMAWEQQAKKNLMINAKFPIMVHLIRSPGSSPREHTFLSGGCHHEA